MQTNRITLLVDDLDRAIMFYTHAFGLTLVEDTEISQSKRIVRVASSKEGVSSLNLTTPKPGDEALVGQQAGQRVFVFIDTENLETDLIRFAENKLKSSMAQGLSHLAAAFWLKILLEIPGNSLNEIRKRKGDPKAA